MLPQVMTSQPVGTVTFLFTDIGGSTQMWERQPEQAQAAIARHNALVTEVLAARDAYIFKSLGDGFFAAFQRPSDAMAAAAELQRAVHAEPWATATPIRVRTALHTGEVESRDGDYAGATVNRASRILAATHPGQAVLSQATYELVRDAVPELTVLDPLGEFQLRDLIRPIQLYQLSSAGVPHAFPPPKGLHSYPNNLPLQFTSFVGREREGADVKRLLMTARLLTLTGSGGCGKSRLALQVGADLLENYPDGVWLVELAPVSDPGLIAQAVAAALGIAEDPGRPVFDAVLAHLRDRTFLLVLDNCEHLIDGSARFVERLLGTCRSGQVLATSREGLGIAGERVWLVPSLGVPASGAPTELGQLTQFDAVRLFIERAASVRVDFVVDERNAPSVAQICWRLDGIPLAIELAAARLRSLTVEDIAKRLDDRFRLLTGGSRTALPRQQTLRALLDWSWDLLNEPERILFRRLAVFAGGWSLEAAEAVCAGDGVEGLDVLDLLARLTEKSLVIADEGSAETRYRRLETVRQYARERLLASGEVEAVRSRHSDYYHALAKDAAEALEGPERAGWLQRLDQEQDNLRSALDWSLESGAETDAALDLAIALGPYYADRHAVHEGERWLSLALARADHPATRAGAAARYWLGWTVLLAGRFPEAQSWLAESLAIYRAEADVQGEARTLVALGRVALNHHTVAEAEDRLLAGLAMARSSGDTSLVVSALSRLCDAATNAGRTADAVAFGEEALNLARKLGANWHIVDVQHRLADVAVLTGDYASASRLYTELRDLCQATGDQRAKNGAMLSLASTLRAVCDHTAARTLLDTCLVSARGSGDRHREARALWGLASVEACEGHYPEASIRYEAAHALSRDHQGHWTLSYGLRAQADLAMRYDDLDYAESLLGESLAVSEAMAHRWSIARSWHDFGRLAALRGDYDKSRASLERARELSQPLGILRMTSTLRELGDLERRHGNLLEARRLCREALALVRDSGIRPEIANALLVLAAVEQSAGANRAAETLLGQALALRAECADRRGVAECHERLAGVASSAGHLTAAARHGGGAEAIREALGASLAPLDRREYEARAAAVLAARHEPAVAAAWRAGRSQVVMSTGGG